MLPQDIPSSLGQEIMADYFHHTGKEYILICDLFNRYPFLFKVTSKSALSLFPKIQELIAQYGPPAKFTLTMALPLLPVS